MAGEFAKARDLARNFPNLLGETDFVPHCIANMETREIGVRRPQAEDMVKSDDPSVFPSLRAWEVFGHDADERYTNQSLR